jgi:hypothetical protein
MGLRTSKIGLTHTHRDKEKNVARVRALTWIALAAVMVIGGLLTTLHVVYAPESISVGLILSIIGGLALLGAAFVVVAGMGLRARRTPGKDISVVAPRLDK